MPQFCMQGASLRCGFPVPAALRSRRLRVQCAASPEQGDAERPSSSKGKSFSGERRRRGRPAHLRSPDDSPLRDGNRDRLMGMLTERAAKTLAYYLIETNHNVHHWVNRFITDHPIPRDGNWDDVSGDTFLRTLLAMPIEEASPLGRDPVFHNTSASDVDPRSIAQRVMEIRAQLATEFIQDLKQVAEDNKLLQLESLQASLLSTEDAIADGSAAARQAANSPGSSSGANSPGGRSVSTGRSSPADDVAKPRKPKKSVLPPQPAPPNWRLRLEVEAQVYGNGDDDTPAAAAGPPGTTTGSSGGIPDSVMTGIISPTYVPSTAPPAAAKPPTAEVAAAAKPPPPPPLHPEVAEMLPLIRSSPSALSPDIAAMLSSLALASNGQLHPDIVDALRAAVAGGAQLHPEMAELIKSDHPPPPSPSPPPPAVAGSGPASAGGSSSGGSLRSGDAAALSSSSSSAPLGQFSKLPGPPGGAASSAAASAAAAPQAVESVQVVQAPQPQQEEEENSITALQNDICLHSDEE